MWSVELQLFSYRENTTARCDVAINMSLLMVDLQNVLHSEATRDRHWLEPSGLDVVLRPFLDAFPHSALVALMLESMICSTSIAQLYLC